MEYTAHSQELELDGARNEKPLVRALEQIDLSQNLAVTTARVTGSTVVATSTGYQVRVEPVPDMFVQSLMAKLPYPSPPKTYIEGKDRYEENPMDPFYVKQCRTVDGQRSDAFTDAILLMSCELIGEMPRSDRWIRKLRMLGIEFDIEDEMEREFAFLKYVVFCRSVDVSMLMEHMGASAEDVAIATERFQRNEERDSDRRSTPEAPGADRNSV